MKKHVALLLTVIMIFAISVQSAFAMSTSGFKDVPRTHWAAENIYSSVMQYAIDGVTDTEFKPNDYITNAQFIKMVSCWMHYVNSKNYRPYVDVSTNDWFVPYLGGGYGYIPVYESADATDPDQNPICGDETKEPAKYYLNPYAQTTREYAIATIAHSIYYFGGYDVPDGARKFSDFDQVNPNFVNEVNFAANKGFISGYSDGTLKPKNKITRAEAATMLINAVASSEPVSVQSMYDIDFTTYASDPKMPISIETQPMSFNQVNRLEIICGKVSMTVQAVNNRGITSFAGYDDDGSYVVGHILYTENDPNGIDGYLSMYTLWRNGKKAPNVNVYNVELTNALRAW